MALTEKYRYCAFLDVLGYSNIVLSGNLSNQQKMEMLEKIYMNNFARQRKNTGVFNPVGNINYSAAQVIQGKPNEVVMD
jgi:hypothetical protein